MCLVGTLVQQTRAVELWPWLKQPSAPQFRYTEMDMLRHYADKATRSISRFARGLADALTPDPVHPPLRSAGDDPFSSGAPKPWQAADPAGPFCVVNLATGNLFCQVPIVSWEGVQFSLYYNSLSSTLQGATLSPGWSHTYLAHLGPITYGFSGPQEVQYTSGDGGAIMFSGEDFDDPVLDPATRLTLQHVGDAWVLTDAQMNQMEFDEDGILTYLRDSSGNTTELIYDDGILIEVRGPGGDTNSATHERELTLEYDDGQLVRAVAPSLFSSQNNSQGGLLAVCCG